MSLFMNRWQKAVCKTYGNGDYRHLTRNPRWHDELDTLGDSLLAFILIELSDAEDCEDAETALNRLETARADIDGAIAQVMTLIRPH